MLPVWHGIDQKTVAKYSPTLADKLAANTERGLDQVALEILKAVRSADDDDDDLEIYRQVEAQSSLSELFRNPSLFVGKTISAYDLIEPIGLGGSGVVFRAQHSNLGREIAVKIFYPLLPELAEFYILYKKGFRALGSLKHPNIVSIVDFGEAEIIGESVFFLAMEYLHGNPLDDWSDNLGDSDESFCQRLKVAISISQALMSAHETTYFDELGFQVQGVLHGDIKPANVIITNSGEAKLLDFLLVDVQRLLDPKVIPRYALRRKIPTTAAFGTPGFMAPEQESKGIVTVQTDIYGLGITLSCMFLKTNFMHRRIIERDTIRLREQGRERCGQLVGRERHGGGHIGGHDRDGEFGRDGRWRGLREKVPV